METVENLVKSFYADEAATTVDSLESSTSLRNTGEIDSLGLAEFYCECEEHWGIEIPDDECRRFQTIGDVVAYVEAAIA